MNFHDLRAKLFEITKKSLKESISRDVLIIQAIHTIKELDEVINRLSANLRERYGYYAPRLCREADTEALIKSGMECIREEMGIALSQDDVKSIKELALEISEIIKLKQSQEKYLDKLMEELCPELKKAATAIIGAELISQAGSLKHLAEVPSSTIQVYGAEKALFRHIKTGARPPRFGVIFAHPSISNAKETEKGKTARKLASKISIAVKKDYFREKL